MSRVASFWIESHVCLGGHPKTRRLAKALGISIPTTVGHLTLFWHQVLQYAQDGDLGAWDDEEIANAAQWEGDAEPFVKALTTARFMDPNRSLHDWHEYMGRLLDKRRTEAERQRRNRAKQKASRSSQQDSADTRTREVPRTYADTEPYQTQPNTTEEERRGPVDPSALRRDRDGADAPRPLAATEDGVRLRVVGTHDRPKENWQEAERVFKQTFLRAFGADLDSLSPREKARMSSWAGAARLCEYEVGEVIEAARSWLREMGYEGDADPVGLFAEIVRMLRDRHDAERKQRMRAEEDARRRAQLEERIKARGKKWVSAQGRV